MHPLYAVHNVTDSCLECGGGDEDGLVLLCDKCNAAHHAHCIGFDGSFYEPSEGWGHFLFQRGAESALRLCIYGSPLHR